MVPEDAPDAGIGATGDDVEPLPDVQVSHEEPPGPAGDDTAGKSWAVRWPFGPR
jgi:hypothetical protein